MNKKAIVAALTVLAGANSLKADKIAYVKRSEVFQKSPYSKELEELSMKLESSLAPLAMELQKMQFEGQEKINSELKAGKPATSPELIKLKNSVEARMKVKSAEFEAKSIDARSEIEEKLEKYKNDLAEDLEKFGQKLADKDGYDHVLDKKAEEVIFSKASYDKTAEAIKFVDEQFKEKRHRDSLLASMTKEESKDSSTKTSKDVKKA